MRTHLFKLFYKPLKNRPILLANIDLKSGFKFGTKGDRIHKGAATPEEPDMIRQSFALTLTAIWLSACNAPASESVTQPAPDYATAALDLSTPENTAHSMMMAMYRGDADMVDAVFVDGGMLRRVTVDGTVTKNALPRWRNWVGTLDVGQAHEEIFALKVQQFGNLATVWAPFVIDVDGKRVGCGVNHLAMVRDGEQWRVTIGMDVQAPIEDCENYKATVMAAETRDPL